MEDDPGSYCSLVAILAGVYIALEKAEMQKQAGTGGKRTTRTSHLPRAKFGPRIRHSHSSTLTSLLYPSVAHLIPCYPSPCSPLPSSSLRPLQRLPPAVQPTAHRPDLAALTLRHPTPIRRVRTRVANLSPEGCSCSSRDLILILAMRVRGA